jgi:hypothetical protein
MNHRYNAKQAAARVGVAYSTIRRRIKAGALEAHPEGRTLWVYEDELRRVFPHRFEVLDLSADEHSQALENATDVSAEHSRAPMGIEKNTDSAFAERSCTSTRGADVSQMSAEEHSGECSRRPDDGTASVVTSDVERPTDSSRVISSVSGEVQDGDAVDPTTPPSTISYLRDQLEQARSERHALHVENEVLHTKLAASEEHHQSTERHLDDVRREAEHLRAVNERLSMAVTNEQVLRLGSSPQAEAIEAQPTDVAPGDDLPEPPAEDPRHDAHTSVTIRGSKRRGWLSRVFGAR